MTKQNQYQLSQHQVKYFPIACLKAKYGTWKSYIWNIETWNEEYGYYTKI